MMAATVTPEIEASIATLWPRVFIGREPRLTHVEADFSALREEEGESPRLKGGRSRGVERSQRQFRVSSRRENPARCRMPTKLRHSRAAISNRAPIRAVNQRARLDNDLGRK